VRRLVALPRYGTGREEGAVRLGQQTIERDRLQRPGARRPGNVTMPPPRCRT
jgi:hypothetical protein